MPQLKTWRFGIDNYIINITKHNVNGVMITGFVEFVKKSEPHQEIVDSYAIMGLKVVTGRQFDTECLYLVNTDLEVFSSYEMTIKIYDHHADIEWFNSLTGVVENKWNAVFLKTQEESFYEYPRVKFLFKNITLNISAHIHKLKNDLRNYFQEGTELTKFEYDLVSIPNFIRGFHENKMLLDIAMNEERIDNKWMHYNSASSLGFMTYIKQKELYYEVSIILTENEHAFLFSSKHLNFSEAEKLTIKLLQSPHILSHSIEFKRDMRNVLGFYKRNNYNIRLTADPQVWGNGNWQDGEIFLEVYDDYTDLKTEKRFHYNPGLALSVLNNLKQEVMDGHYDQK